MLFSASTGHKQTNYLLMQPIWCAVGLIACWLAATIDYRWLKAYPWVPWAVLAFVCALLALVLVPGIKVSINGASRWLKAGPFTMQPSELAKLGLIIALAHYGERYQRWMPTFWRGMVIPSVIVAIVLGLIFVEPDVGTALLVGMISSIMLLIAGIRWRYFVPPVLVALVALGMFLWQNPMRSERIYSWLHLEETKMDKGMQAYQAMVALGSGGATGVGLGDGRQKLGRIPEHHTDFIFSIIGEELGLSATLFIMTAFFVIVVCGVYIAWHACDTFGMLLASGITFLIGLQAVINIGVVTGSLPNKGLSLPFISYGGSNLVVMLTCVGLLASIARRGAEVKRSPARLFGSDSAALSYS